MKIDVGRDFSKYPGGRYRANGRFSGEAFREDVLIPAMRNNEKIFIFLDTTIGYGSSFLEEAFGGLVRSKIGTANEINSRLKLMSRDHELVEEIQHYVSKAGERAH